VESFWPGPFAFACLPQRDRDALEALFPGIGADPVAAYGPLARPCLTMRALRALPAEAIGAWTAGSASRGEAA
jgi:hypothetical protein